MNQPATFERYALEGILDVSQLAQQKRPEAESILLGTYAGMMAHRQGAHPSSLGALFKTIRAIAQIYRDSGPARDEKEFDLICFDPQFRQELLDIEFPSDPLDYPHQPHDPIAWH
jgi:hypothetical protein